MAAHSVLPE